MRPVAYAIIQASAQERPKQFFMQKDRDFKSLTQP